MEFVTNEKLTIVGAAGMIGSNMAQTAIMMGLTPNICLYDPYAPGLEGVAEELFHCGFEGVNITFTSDIKEALTGAKYIVNSGGAARKAGMTREDLLKGNAAIAEEFGKNVKQYCPDVKHIVVIFNPADITGLITLLYSGLKPGQVTTLAALDSTRLRSELAKHFGISMDAVENCRTYGGHGEQMAVFASTAKVNGKALTDIIGTDALTKEQWAEIQQKVTKGGANIINLRGRSSFQSPAYNAVKIIWMCRWRENRKKQVAFATCAILLQTVREITLIIGDQNIDRVVEMRRLDYEVCRCHVGGDRNVPYRRQTQQGFHVRIVRYGI